MNHALFGNDDFTEQLLQTKQPFLLIDDGPLADAFLEEFPRAKLFDVQRHSFNPLKDIDYKRSRDFAEIVYTASPQGQTTLTVRNGRRALVTLLKAGSLADLPSPRDTTDDGEKEALATVADLLASPVLRDVLCGKPNFFFKGSVVAKLDRAVIGDFDAFILASLLIGQSKGQIVMSDSSYLRDFHLSLIRQNRLTVVARTLSRLSDTLQDELLFVKDKTIGQCTWDDAVVLAKYAGHEPGTRGYADFLQSATDDR